MNQEIVEVVEIGEGGVWVEGIQRSACGSCSARAGCGQHTLSKLGRPVRLWVETHDAYSLGNQVVLALPEGSLAFSALSLYGLPLIGLVIGAVLGNQGGSEAQSMMAGMLGLVIGLGAARLFARRNKDDWQPTIVKECSGHSQAIEINTLD